MLNNLKMSHTIDDYILVPCRQDDKNKFPSVSGYFEIENKPFRINTIFFIGNLSSLKKALRKHEGIDLVGLEKERQNTFSGMTIPCTTEGGGSFVLIWMPTFEWSVDDVETLSHECVHASIMLMRMSGVKSKIFDAEKDEDVDDEALAYRSSSMFISILNELIKKQNRNIKKKISKK